MKKITSILFFLVFLAVSLNAAERLRERVYISTDRDVYVAGDAVWMSAWCVDASGKLSGFSKVAYVEVHSSTGMVQTARIALEGGRGAGRLFLPNTLPTGNYRLFAYTKQGAAEEGFDPLAGARTISVFNTFSTERTPQGVTFVSGPVEAPYVPESGQLRIDVIKDGGATPIVLANNGSETMNISLSVRHQDEIPAPAGAHIGDFVESVHNLPAAGRFDDSVIPEYEGEIIMARVTGTNAEGLRAVKDKYAFISSPGGENVYSASIDGAGEAMFVTSNIFGEQSMFLEIEGVDKDNICHLEIRSPFLDLDAGNIPALPLSKDYASALELRGLGMQLEKNFDADTLYSYIPPRTHLVFDEKDCTRYLLDDYTRFPVMEELFVEFVQEIRVRKVDGKKQLQVRITDPTGNGYFPNGTVMALLDGVPVLDHEKILAYDPLLVRSIDIYCHSYFLGIRGFTGVVNFVTYKGTLPSFSFEDNVRVVDFDGCSIPMAYTCEGVGKEYPDFRQTLYWNPLITLAPGESVTVYCKRPDYGGSFEVFAEGLTADGSSVSESFVYEVGRP
jgi:hypothetical protein